MFHVIFVSARFVTYHHDGDSDELVPGTLTIRNTRGDFDFPNSISKTVRISMKSEVRKRGQLRFQESHSSGFDVPTCYIIYKFLKKRVKYY